MRKAICMCGQLSVAYEGEPFRVSVCHCLDCQRRSGSAFAAQARFETERVTVAGGARVYTRRSESGHTSNHHFCPQCGCEMWYVARPFRDTMAIPIGRFAEPGFPAPQYSVYEARKHAWVAIVGEATGHYE